MMSRYCVTHVSAGKGDAVENDSEVAAQLMSIRELDLRFEGAILHYDS